MYIPTALSAREDELLRRYSRGKIVTEAGSLLGHSTIQLATSARRVTSIDRHTGYAGIPNNTLRALRRNLEVAGVSGRVDVVIGEASLLSEYPADFVFIDLCGTYHGTLEAIRAARAPVIAVHDYARQNCSGVGRAVDKLGLSVMERVDSLIVLANS